MNARSPDGPTIPPAANRPTLTVLPGGRLDAGPDVEVDDWDDLHAWVDGALTPVSSTQVALSLAKRPDTAAKAFAYRAQLDGLHALYDPVLNEPIPERLLETVRAAQQPRRRWRIRLWPAAVAAAAVALLLAGHSLRLTPAIADPSMVRLP